MNITTLLKSILSTVIIITFTLRTEFITITSVNEFNKLIAEKKPMILKFSAAYCPPCKVTKQPFEELSQEQELNTIGFIELDIQSPAGSTLSAQYKILGVPTFIFIRDGKELRRVVGLEHPATFKEELRNQLKEIFTTTTTTTKPENDEITKIKVEDEVTAPQPSQEGEKPVSREEAPSVLKNIWLSVQAFFIFIFDKIKDAINYIIDLIKGIFGGK